MNSPLEDIIALGQPARYTDRAVETFSLGLRCAAEIGDDCFDSAHLLSGLAREPDGVAHHILANLGVDQGQIDDRLRRRHDRRIERKESQSETDELSDETVASRINERDLQRVLDETTRAAKSLGHRYMGTEHLIIGATVTGTQSANVLSSLGITRGAVTKEVYDLLGHTTTVQWLRRIAARLIGQR
ncbi:MAG: hypothetical protein HKN47_22270 [Pirellulaceae bacterium]|nr:hypothetical protein [Pirellulaceae bacterium]